RCGYGKQRQYVARLNALTAAHLRCILRVQVFGRQRKDYDEFRGHNRALLGAHMEVVHSFALFEPVVAMVAAITTAIIIVVGGRFVLHQELTIGRFVAFLLLVSMYYNPVREIADR